MINKNVKNYSITEHNNLVAGLPLASHIKLVFLNCDKQIKRLREREEELVECHGSKIKDGCSNTLIELEHLTRDYGLLEKEIQEIYSLLSGVSYMIDKYELWKDESNSVEELKSLL